MWIFFRHLPRGTTVQEINKVTLKGCKSAMGLTSLFKKSPVKLTKIIRISNLQTKDVEYHGMVQIDSPAIAESIIENLDGKTVNGLFIKSHQYHRRFPSRDRRNHQLIQPHHIERRNGDRRRDNLVTRVVEIN